ncbi:TRAP-type C4-dicarboxylate transport system permease small subunit [Geomicrobium halophilum]|uniref:TRAP-type C4-dicarboxylate transport system permease small subunit n=1 Tax=Geomicrobium halophilum TaxID=549000 RepID=A0A841Q0U3_9BACL|nr:TRAP transporter small permease [Geomicrobium halophilum]MBB6451332.1 TRAP-type C4-dicarboxylate transport system permease small subunit [Geomicrobium halophilum]
MWRYITKAEIIITKISKFAQIGASAALLFIMFLIPLDILLRRFFNQSITGAYELVEIGTAFTIFFALAMTSHYKEHIAIGFLVDKLSHRTRNAVEGVVDVVVFIVVTFVGIQLFEHAMRIMDRSTTTNDLGLPLYPFIIIVSISTFIFAAKVLCNGLNHFREVVQKS